MGMVTLVGDRTLWLWSGLKVRVGLAAIRVMLRARIKIRLRLGARVRASIRARIQA